MRVMARANPASVQSNRIGKPVNDTIIKEPISQITPQKLKQYAETAWDYAVFYRRYIGYTVLGLIGIGLAIGWTLAIRTT